MRGKLIVLEGTVVDCARNGVPRTPEDIHAEVAALAADCLSR